MRVLNKYRDEIPPDAVNIMRPGPFGNPFVMKTARDRAAVIEKHMEYARQRVSNDPYWRALVLSLEGHDLVCCCSPKPCHGHNLVKLIQEMKKGEI